MPKTMSTVTTPKKRSLEKRSNSSTVKFRSKLDTNSKTSLKSNKVNPTAIVQTILNEITDNVMNIIYEKYLEEKMIQFTVDCALEALTKTLKMHFYEHNDYKRDLELWGSETRAEPSRADSWALQKVPLCKNLKTDAELNTLSSIKEQFSQVVEADLDISEPSESLIDDLEGVIDGVVNVLPIEEEVESETTETIESVFSMIVEGSQHYDQFKMKPELSKISTKPSTMLRLPKIDLPVSGISRKCLSFSEFVADETTLPPIRTDASYKCREVSMRTEDKKKSRKK